MSAPELSAEEAAIVYDIERAPPAPESLRERVAAAIADADYYQATAGLLDWTDLSEDERGEYRSQADAAIAVMRGSAPESFDAAVVLRRLDARIAELAASYGRWPFRVDPLNVARKLDALRERL